MAAVTKMAAAAKLAEERIRLDIGDDISVEDEVILLIRITHVYYSSVSKMSSRKLVLPTTSTTCASTWLCVFRMWALAARPRVHRLIPYLSIIGPGEDHQWETQRPLL